ncbi:MAG: GNAT family N-acetyltransferase, partial [Candidatus Geothermarchaeales archaeon]
DKEDVAYLLNSIGNDMPRMEMSMEDMEFTPDQVWGDRQRNIETGQRYWTYVARDPQTSKLVGFTEVTWRPETLGEDGHLWQADTGVLKDYRRRGIGRWLKVAMLDRILRKFAEARFITTESAEVNEPMHSLNRSLGFKVYNKFWSWELELTRLRNYLDQKRSIPS